jgi:hypothetical protein
MKEMPKLPGDPKEMSRPTWLAEAFAPLNEKDGSFVRLNGPLGPLPGPMLLCFHIGSKTQLKVVFGETPMFFATEFIESDFQALKQYFINAAKALDAVSPADMETARQLAGGLIRAQLMGRDILPLTGPYISPLGAN